MNPAYMKCWTPKPMSAPAKITLPAAGRTASNAAPTNPAT
jgi:hypothetical protein